MTNTLPELPPEALIRRCDPDSFDFETTDDLPPLSDFIGQERAMRAVDFGAGIASHGFNVYAMGLPGSGKTTLTRKYLEQIAAKEPTPEDWCYVNNFEEPHKPRTLRLPAGQGVALRDELAELINHCRQDIPKAFQSEEYEQEKEKATKSFQEEQEKELKALQEQLAEDSFALLRVPGGLVLTPAIEGRPLRERDLGKLSEEEREKVQRLRNKLEKEVEHGLRRLREMEEEMRKALQQLDEETTLRAIGHLVNDLRAKYAETPLAIDYLEGVQADIVANVDDFKSQKETEGPTLMGTPLPVQAASAPRYEVNVLVDRSGTEGAPVVIESNPTYHNLIGRIEHHAFMGAVATDFTMIKPGALHRANGGYLVLPVREVLINYLSWDALKRSLKDRRVRIEELGAQLSLVSTVTLEPETIPLDVKIVLIGNPLLYYLLHAYDEDFQKLFKVKADFANLMDRSPDTEGQYALFVHTISKEHGLNPFDRGAVSRLIEHSSRMVEHQDKLSTRFGEITDLLQEANFWAGRRVNACSKTDEAETPTKEQEAKAQPGPENDNATVVSACDVEQAINEKIFRNSLLEERLQEVIAEGTLRIDTTGTVVGQVNGLSLISLGDYAFSRPSRVTASTYIGKSGVVNIEREVELSGPIHSKGVLILASYLGHKYAQKESFTLSASLVFEQSYSGVEGDSASSTELYALLSSLSGFPVKQGIAVTGSVDQHGRVQPIGGVNEKIEGFFDVCQAKGLTGDQGVIIPVANERHLMLRQDVIDAVADDRFHIWAVRSVDEGIALLTGRDAGEQDEEGRYAAGSVNRAVADRLAEMAAALKKEGEEENKDD
jgi:lon-related putative ATP-dependent protease